MPQISNALLPMDFGLNPLMFLWFGLNVLGVAQAGAVVKAEVAMQVEVVGEVPLHGPAFLLLHYPPR